MTIATLERGWSPGANEDIYRDSSAFLGAQGRHSETARTRDGAVFLRGKNGPSSLGATDVRAFDVVQSGRPAIFTGAHPRHAGCSTDGVPPCPSSSLPRYEVHEKIGEGGMACIFRGVAHEPDGTRRDVVIKRLREHLTADVAAVRRFLNEGEVHGRVHHPNVVALHAIEVDASGTFLVLEWIDGASLRQLAERAAERRARLDPSVTLSVVIDALRGLHAAHTASDAEGGRLGVLHRDATPDNILVGRDGRARLTDFGVAKCRGGPNLTDRGMVVGKLDYLSPEYLDRQPVDARMDIFAMGMTAWVTLAGRRPFGCPKGVPTDLLTRRVPELDAGTGVSPEVARVVHRACQSDPGDRYSTAAEMADALEAAAVASDDLATPDEVGAAVADLLGLLPPQRVSTPPSPPEKTWVEMGVAENLWREESPTRTERVPGSVGWVARLKASLVG